MIRLELDPASLARIRITPSPVYEATSWLAWAAAGRRHPVWGDPGPAARLALREQSVAVTAVLARGSLSGRYIPDFLTPKPEPGSSSGEVRLRQQLEQIRSTPAADVQQQLRMQGAPSNWTVSPDRLPALVAAGLARFWHLAVADLWPRLDRVLLQDRERRTVAFADAGLGAVLSTLHPGVGWRNGRLDVDKPYHEHIRYVDAEIVLVPSALAGPTRLAAQVCDPTNATLAYPVPAGTAVTRPGLTALLGHGRANVLRATGTGASTRQLAQELGVAPATVSRHLHVLHDAGLLSRRRKGRIVIYAQTDAAHQLQQAAG